jgi:hypothetical protein
MNAVMTGLAQWNEVGRMILVEPSHKAVLVGVLLFLNVVGMVGPLATDGTVEQPGAGMIARGFPSDVLGDAILALPDSVGGIKDLLRQPHGSRNLDAISAGARPGAQLALVDETTLLVTVDGQVHASDTLGLTLGNMFQAMQVGGHPGSGTDILMEVL